MDEKEKLRIAKFFTIELIGASKPPYIVTTAPHAQPPEIRCYECNHPYGILIPYVHSVMEFRQRKFLERTGINSLFAPALTGGVPEVGDVLDGLGLQNHCCRRIFTTMRYIGEKIYIPINK